MRGIVTLYSWNHNALMVGEYESIEERKMIMRIWADRFSPIGYYFIVEPIVKDEAELKSVYVQEPRVIKKPRNVLPKKVELVRPLAVYDNKSPYGIANEVHRVKVVEHPFARPVKKHIRR